MGKYHLMNDNKNFIKIHVPSSMIEVLHENVRDYQEKPIIIYENREMTYTHFDKRTNQIAHGLLSYGVKEGERVAILTRNIPELLAAVIAAAKIRAIAVPINYRLAGNQIDYLFVNCNPSVLIIESDFLDKIRPIKKKFQNMIVFSVDTCETGESVLPFNKLYENQDPSGISTKINIDDDFIILYTSGTTGKPKGAVVTHRNAIAWALAYKYCTNLTAEDRTLIACPLFHQTGLCDQFLTLLYLGGTCIIQKRYRTEECLKLIDRYKPTTWVMAPTMLIWMMDFPTFDRYDTSSVRINCYGGGPISPKTIKQVKECFPNSRCYNVFGSTEGYISILPDDQCLNRLESAGLPVIFNENCIRIVDNDGNDVPIGRMGEIIVKENDGIIKRYWNNPEASKNAFKGGWFYTGDLARMDEAGYLYLGDRKKDVICRGGENIYSVGVENVLCKHPAVLEAAVFGVLDKTFGQIVKAAVVLREKILIAEHEIKDFCRIHLADYEIPTEIIFVKTLPTNAAGKVDKRKLSKKYG